MKQLEYNKDKRKLGGFIHDEKLEELAREGVGSGKTPNLYFVTVSNFIATEIEGEIDSVPVDGKGGLYAMVKSFETIDEANKFANSIELDIDGVCEINIEDYEEGTVKTRILKKTYKVSYSEIIY